MKRTLPPTARERARLEWFEHKIQTEGEPDARLANLRRSTTLRLAGLELPECFAAATVSAGINAIDRDTVSARAARRRAVSKALKVAGAS